MKIRYKITGMILSIAMLLSVLTPFTVSAEEVAEAPITEEAPRELTLEDLLAGAATVEEVYGVLERETVPEIVGYEKAKEAMHVRRLYADEGENLNKVVFLNADLTKTVYLFDHPVKYVDEKGMIQDITLEIEEDLSSNTLQTANASAVTGFSKNSLDGISLRGSGVNLSLVPVLSEKSASGLSRSNTRARLENQKKVVYSYDTKTDLEYTLTYTGFKEEIVVKEYTGQTRYDFTLYTNGLKVVEKNGSFSLEDGAGKTRALLGDIIIFTADEKNNTMGEMTATPVVENQEYLLSVFVDAAFLSDPKTAYPIRIDPTVEICYNNNGAGAIQDITLNSLQGSDGSSGSLFVGKRDTYGISRFLMKFPGLNFSTLGDNVTITQATVYIRDLLPDNNAMPLNCHVFTGYIWYENTASWSNASPNSYLASPVSSHTISSYMGQQQAEWYYFGFDITSVVAGWKSGAYVQEKGLIFKAADSVENGSTLVHKTFGSYNRSSYKPSLTVTYSEDIHTTPEGVYYLNNAYSGKYLRYSSSQNLGVQSGLIANLGNTIHWQLVAAAGANNYALVSNADPSKYLAIKDNGSLEVVTHSGSGLPARCIWYRGVTSLGGYLRSTYNSRYLISDETSLSTAATQGTSGTDAFRQSSWRIASTTYYGNTSAYNGRELQSGFTIDNLIVNIGANKVPTVHPFPTGALWSSASDFEYIYSAWTENCVLFNYATGSATGLKTGVAYYIAKHKVTNRTYTFKIYVDRYTYELENLYGFSSSDALMIREFYDRIDATYPNESNLQRAWRAARVLSEAVYDGFVVIEDVTLPIEKWDDVAGDVTDSIVRRYYFESILGYTENEYELIEAALTNQHDRANGGNLQIGDFVHMQYSLASRLAYRLNKDGMLSNIYTVSFDDEYVSYWGGWFGDATIKGDDGIATFGFDDYIADLDAENLFKRIEEQNHITAIRDYYDILSSSNTVNRATIFLGHISYETVEDMVLDELDLTLAQVQATQPDTYNFLMSLQNNRATMGSF